MATQGPNGPSSGADSATAGVTAWTNPGNITADDGTFATCATGGLPTNSHYLVATGFGFTIPNGATVDGITVGWKRKGSGPSAVTDSSSKIVQGGTVSGTEHSAGVTWSTSNTIDTTFGSSTDLWGLTWAAADVNASNFGAALSAAVAGSSTASVDYCQVTVFYTAAFDPAAGAPYPPQSIPPRLRQTREVVAY